MNAHMPTIHKATLRYLRMAPRKVRLVGDMIKGLSANDAEAQLLHERRRAAKAILKLLRSAVANAKQAKQADPDRLMVKSISVDGGPMLKRSFPRARGTATLIQKKMSHVTITLAEGPEAKSRFTILPTKKSKLPKAEREKKRQSEEKPMAPRRSAERLGFWKRMFRRKAV